MRKLLYLLALIACVDSYACNGITHISNQEQFDEAMSRINQGEEMHLVLHKGLYVLKQSLSAKAPVTIKGKKTVITSATRIFNSQESFKTTDSHYIYKLSKPLALFPLFYDVSGTILPISESVIDSTKVNYIDGDIITPNEFGEGVEIKIPIPEHLNHLRNKSFSMAFGYFDCGWTVMNFRLNRADNNYFYCSTLTECFTNNYQYDKKVYKKPIRFVLYNADIKSDAIYFDNDYLYIPKSVDEFYYLNREDEGKSITKLVFNSDVKITNVDFCGIGGLWVDSKPESICEIKNCNFSNSLGCSLSIFKRKGEVVTPANICRCTFKSCAVFEDNVLVLKSDYGDDTCIIVKECEISRYPDDIAIYKNAVNLVNVSGNVLLSRNVIYNNCRGLLALNRGRIIAQDNFLYNKDSFYRFWDRNTSNDWGLIYCSILLKNNLIYGAYAYGGDARGIFIDDGRGDVGCIGNIILNTQVYSIDARKSTTSAASVRNRYEKNVLTSNYRLAAGDSVRGSDVPIIDANVLTSSKTNVVQNAIVENDDNTIPDLDISCSFSKGKILVSSGLFKIIKQSDAWRGIKKYVIKK